MKILISFVLLVSLGGVFCTKNEKPEKRDSQLIVEESDSTIYIKAKEFEGVVFKPSFRWGELGEGIERIKYPILLALPENKDVEPWVPTITSILSFESNFHRYWEKAKTDSLATLNNKVTIPYKRIDRLKRQYMGFIDSSNVKNIWVNLLGGGEPGIEWRKEPIIIDGGGMFKRSFYYDVEKDSITKVLMY